MKKFTTTIAIIAAAVLTGYGQQDEARKLLNESGTKGGLVVHLGCGDGQLTGALAESAASLVIHGLDSDPASVQKARKHFQSLDAVERLSAELWSRDSLPYADKLVNLLIVDQGSSVSEKEAMRVLSPGGRIIRKKGGEWKVESKAQGSGKGEWTHYQFDATNNMVGDDPNCGLPRQFQWSGTPLWSTAHESMSSLNAMVTTKGRVFYIIDEGPRASVQLPSDWQLVARDAYNGVVLWRKPIKQWLTRFWPWKSGPAQMPRKLVAIGDRGYAPLDINGPLKQFDAATGKELQTYEGTAAAEEFIYTDGILLVQVNPDPSNMAELEEQRRKRRHFSYDGRNRAVIDHDKAKRIVAVEAKSGKRLWERVGPRVSPLSLGSINGNAVYHDGEQIVCLDLKSGEEKWKSDSIPERLQMVAEEAPTLVLNENAVYYARNKKMTVVSLKDGKQLWTSDWTTNDYRSPVTAMLMNDLVWSMDMTSARAPGTFTGRDPLSGEIKKQFDLPPFQGIGHHRCYKAKASGNYVLLSRSGVEYVDPTTQSYDENHWVRGGCLYGIMPANGMLYSTPHACACYLKGKLNGFTAMTPGPTGPGSPPDSDNSPHEKGQAYLKKVQDKAVESDWPTYRGNVERSGRSKFPVTTTLKQSWKTKLGGDLSTLTVGNGLVLVAQRKRNTVHALHANDGSEAWQFTAGGMVDSPPTISEGFVYFGSADGCVYSLRASDGALAWRTRAAPSERRVVAYGRVESAWPVHGSVVAQNGFVYAAAGRPSFLDGGISMVKIDARTGKIIGSHTVYDFDSEGKQPPLEGSFDMQGALTDILSGDGKQVYMRHLSFDQETLSPGEPAPHAFSPTGFLDDNWWRRTYWVYGEDTKAGYGAWWKAGNKLPAGRILVNDDDSVYAFGRSFYAGMNAAQFGRGEKYILYASEKKSGKEPDYVVLNKERRRSGDLNLDWEKYRTTPIKWSGQIPFNVRAMALADKILFAAGPYGDAVRSMGAFQGTRGNRLAAVSVTDGKMIASYAIDALPVFDGLAAANDHLFIAFKDGTVRAFGASGEALESKLGEAIEVLPEKLDPSDEKYRIQTKKMLGQPIPKKKK